MSLEDFLSASYALLTEEHQRIDPLKDLLSLSEQITPPARATVDAQNDQSLQQFNSMMSGVQKRR